MMADVTGRTTSVYDPLQRAVSVTNSANQRITYGFDQVSNRTRLVTPDGGYFTYTWDATSRISNLLNPLLERTTFGFDAIGRQSFQVLGNSTRASWAYDAANNIANLANLNSSGAALSSFAYLYDPVGNRQRVVEANGDRVSWAYDATYQLTHEIRDGANAYEVTHIWDPVGNRLVKIDGGVRTTATYNTANELVWVNDGTGRTTFAFDGTGNLARELSPALARTSYSWDGDNRLLAVSLPSAIINTMVYNAGGLRVEKVDSSGTTKSLWDGQNVLLDANASNVTQALYTLQPSPFGSLLSQSRGGASSFYLFDALGSTAGLSDNLQVVTDSYLFKAFGELLARSGSSRNTSRFAAREGYLFDQDLLAYYLRNREYSPRRAAFYSPRRRVGTNMPGSYVYVWNNPVALTDPSGEPLPVIAGAALGILLVCLEGAGAGGLAQGIADVIEDLINGVPVSVDWGAVECSALTGCWDFMCVTFGAVTILTSPLAPVCLYIGNSMCNFCTLQLGCRLPYICI